MTNYPGALDTTADLPVDRTDATPRTGNHAEDHNNAHEAILAMQAELGANPSGTDATVADRLAGILAGSGAWLKSELPPYVLPRGIGGNATTQTSEIAAALAASSEVFLPPGVFPTTGLTALSAKRLRGVGTGTILRLKDSTTADVISASTIDQFEVCDLVIDGNKAGQTVGGKGVELADCTRSTIRRVEFKNVATRVVDLDGGSDLIVEDCLFRDNGIGTSILGLYCPILAYGGISRLRISRNIINGAADSAIIASSCYDVVIAENIIDTCFFIGIGLGAGDGNNVTITGNVIRNTEGNGIDTGTATGVTVSDNAITDCFDGIDADMSSLGVRTAADLAITGNKIKNCASWGIIVGGSTVGGSHGVTIADNVIDTAQLQGIMLASVHSATVQGNIVRNVSRFGEGYGGINLDHSGTACTDIVIIGNRIYEDADVTPHQCYAIHKGTGGDYNTYALNNTRGCLAAVAGVAGANDIVIAGIT